MKNPGCCLFIKKPNDKAKNEKILHINYNFKFNTSTKIIFFVWCKNDYDCDKPQT